MNYEYCYVLYPFDIQGCGTILNKVNQRLDKGLERVSRKLESEINSREYNCAFSISVLLKNDFVSAKIVDCSDKGIWTTLKHEILTPFTVIH